MNNLQKLLQKLIPKPILIRKLTIEDLTGEVISSIYYLSVEDYYKINETINDLICAINFVVTNTNINFTDNETVSTSIQSVINQCPVITTINGLKLTSIKNLNILTAFYLNGKKYQYNEVNLGNISLHYNFISGTMGDYVTTINGIVDNVHKDDKGIQLKPVFNRNHITGGLSGIAINNITYYPFSTYFWNTAITTIPANTSALINNEVRKITETNTDVVLKYAKGECNNIILTLNTQLYYTEIIPFRIDAIHDKQLSAYTSAYFDGDVLIELTKEAPVPIDLNLKIEVGEGDNKKLYYLNGDIEFYTKGVESERFFWDSSITFLPPFTNIINVNNTESVVTTDRRMPVKILLCSGKCNGFVLSSNTPLTTSFNGKIDLGSYCTTDRLYITSINGKSLQHMYLLSGVKYGNQIYPNTTTSLLINKDGRYIPVSEDKTLTYTQGTETKSFTLKEGDLTNPKSAITKKQLTNWTRNEIIRKMPITENIIVLLKSWYPLHVYDLRNRYVENGIENIELVLLSGLIVNRVTLKISTGTLTIMKVV